MRKPQVSALLAGATALAIGSPAGAADMVKAEKATEYVRICATYGAGYYYIPGTDTCLKIGGYVRSDTYVNAVGTFNPPISNVAGRLFKSQGGIGGYPLRTDAASDYFTRTRGLLSFETRTLTDYGVVRTVFRAAEQWDSITSAGTGSGSSLYFERAFIQFAGFTAGYANSFFNTGTGITYIMGTPYAGDNMWNTVLAYTLELGNGLSTSLSLEDSSNRTTGIQAGAANSAYSPAGALLPTATNGMSYVNFQSGMVLPDLVGNVRLDQSWGTLMLSGALHRVDALSPLADPAIAYLGESTDSALGWALGAIAQFNLPMIAKGDRIYFQANYADGALNYLGLSGTPQVHASGLGSISVGPTLQTSRGAYYPIADAVWDNATLSYSNESGWALSAQYRHYWMPSLRSSFYLGYVAVDVPDNTVGAFDVNITQAAGNLVWTPVRNLDIGAEVIYSRVAGDVPLANRPATTATGAATYATTGGSTDVWSGGLRFQRNF